MPLTLEELKELLITRYDPELLIDVLEITTEDLLNAFSDRVAERRIKFADEEEEYESNEI